jgi:iron complex transport system substrate-binding protein
MKNGIPGPLGLGIFFWGRMARTAHIAAFIVGIFLAVIVSLAPSLTETLFALGLGERVVGVTRYCAHPPEVAELQKVGGHLDPNFEAIVSLEPDLVVVIPSSSENRRRLESLGIKVLEVDQHDVQAVLESVEVVAEACGVPDRGANLRAEIDRRLAAIRSVVEHAARPRAVVVVGHQAGDGTVRSVWAAGPDTFYDGVMQLVASTLWTAVSRATPSSRGRGLHPSIPTLWSM